MYYWLILYWIYEDKLQNRHIVPLVTEFRTLLLALIKSYTVRSRVAPSPPLPQRQLRENAPILINKLFQLRQIACDNVRESLSYIVASNLSQIVQHNKQSSVLNLKLCLTCLTKNLNGVCAKWLIYILSWKENCCISLLAPVTTLLQIQLNLLL